MSAARRQPRWNARWACRAAIALTPLGALVAIVHSWVTVGEPVTALLAYAVGGAAAAVVGFLVGGLAGAVNLRLERRAARRRARPATGWVLHRAAPVRSGQRLVARH